MTPAGNHHLVLRSLCAIITPTFPERTLTISALFPKFGKPSRSLAIVEALIVNLIWASTFVLVKIGLNDLGPLTLAGLRYFGAFLLLLPFLNRNHHSAARRAIPTRVWARLFWIGFFAYVVANGALFIGLQFIPATTGSFMLSLFFAP